MFQKSNNHRRGRYPLDPGKRENCRFICLLSHFVRSNQRFARRSRVVFRDPDAPLCRSPSGIRESTPQEIAAILDHPRVPRVWNPDPFQDIRERILAADQLLAQGRLQPPEHRLLTEKIVDFYGY